MKKLHYERPVIQRLNVGIMNKFGTKTEYVPVTHIDGNAVANLLSKFGSPLFVISEKTIRQTFRDANRAFKTRYPKVQFAWSYKTNYVNAVCHVFHQEGSWAEVVSGFEYQKALQNGVPGSKIIFNGPDKSEAELSQAIENNSLIHIDHLDELYMIKELAANSKKKPRVAIRVNMDTGVYPIWDRFGFNYENGQAWDAINKILLNDQMELVGLHCHIGTFMLAPSAYGLAASKLCDLAINIKKK
jgi:diaminopimelate decarboxylase